MELFYWVDRNSLNFFPSVVQLHNSKTQEVINSAHEMRDFCPNSVVAKELVHAP